MCSPMSRHSGVQPLCKHKSMSDFTWFLFFFSFLCVILQVSCWDCFVIRVFRFIIIWYYTTSGMHRGWAGKRTFISVIIMLVHFCLRHDSVFYTRLLSVSQLYTSIFVCHQKIGDISDICSDCCNAKLYWHYIVTCSFCSSKECECFISVWSLWQSRKRELNKKALIEF